MGSSRQWWLNRHTPLRVANCTGSLVFPWRSTVSQLGLIESVDGFCQRVAVSGAVAAHGGYDARFGKMLGETNTDVQRRPVGVTDQACVALGFPGAQGLLQRI